MEWKIDYNHKLLNFGVLLQAHKNKNKSNLIILKVQIDFFSVLVLVVQAFIFLEVIQAM